MNYFKYDIFLKKIFARLFGIYIKIKNAKHSNYKKKNIEVGHLNNMQKILFLELEKDFIQLKERELKNRKIKIKLGMVG